MKRKDNEGGVPRRTGKVKNAVTVVIAGCFLLAASVAAGYMTAPEDIRIPVLLANGEVIMQPCYVAVDGECIALVKNEAVAEEVVDRVKEEYKNADTTSVEIEENASIEKLELENGSEKPEILSAQEASEQIVDEKTLTVKTVEVVKEEKTVEYKIIEKDSEELSIGEQKIERQGEKGLTRVTKQLVKENGVIVSETVLDEETVKESVPEIVISGTAGVADPLEEMRITSTFGARWGRQHEGLDLGAPDGTPIYAAKTGTVVCAEYQSGFGNLVIIDHGSGMKTYYAHCSRLDVVSGQQVVTGQQIGAVGSTGNSTGPHLHFEVHVNDMPQDPEEYLLKSDDTAIKP